MDTGMSVPGAISGKDGVRKKKLANGRGRKDLVAKRNQPLRRLFRFVRRTWIWVLVAGVLFWATQDANVANALLVVAGYAVQIAVMLGLAILQFVAIFWFMAQTKVE